MTEPGNVTLPHINEPIGFITIPVYCDLRPFQSKGFLSMKFADCILDVKNADGVDLGSIGGAVGGAYLINCDSRNPDLPGSNGRSFHYRLRPKDIWDAMTEVDQKFQQQTVQDVKSLLEKQGDTNDVAIQD